MRPEAALLHKLPYSWLQRLQNKQQNAQWIKTALQGAIYRPKEWCTWTKSTNGTSLTKDTVKRQNSIMKGNSGMKEQYSTASIFGRIYQHCTTCEQKAFTLNHHHTTTFDNSRLPENTPRLCIRVLLEQNNPDICSGAAKGEVYSSFEQLRLKTL